MSQIPAHKSSKVVREGGRKIIEPADKKPEKSEEKVDGTPSKE